MNPRTVRFTSSGCSCMTLCEAPGTIHRRAPGMVAASVLVCSGRTTSCSPAITSTGTRMDRNSSREKFG